jgi:hypothetical protein
VPDVTSLKGREIGNGKEGGRGVWLTSEISVSLVVRGVGGDEYTDEKGLTCSAIQKR